MSDKDEDPMRTVCLVLLVLGGIAVYWWLRTYEPVGVIQDQLTAIDEGQYPQAYHYLSSTARAKLPSRKVRLRRDRCHLCLGEGR